MRVCVVCEQPLGEPAPEATLCVRCDAPIEACAGCVEQWRKSNKLIVGFGMRWVLELRHRCAA